MAMQSALSRYGHFIIGFTVGVLICFSIGAHYLRAQSSATPVKANPIAALPIPSGLLEEEKNTIQLFQQAAASVVYITNKTRRTDLFTLNVMEIPQGSGSGFLWDNKGHV